MDSMIVSHHVENNRVNSDDNETEHHDLKAMNPELETVDREPVNGKQISIVNKQTVNSDRVSETVNENDKEEVNNEDVKNLDVFIKNEILEEKVTIVFQHEDVA